MWNSKMNDRTVFEKRATKLSVSFVLKNKKHCLQRRLYAQWNGWESIYVSVLSFAALRTRAYATVVNDITMHQLFAVLTLNNNSSLCHWPHTSSIFRIKINTKNLVCVRKKHTHTDRQTEIESSTNDTVSYRFCVISIASRTALHRHRHRHTQPNTHPVQRRHIDKQYIELVPNKTQIKRIPFVMWRVSALYIFEVVR